MIHLLRLEWLKIRRARFTYVLLFLLLLTAAGYFFYIDTKETKLHEAEAYVLSNVETSMGFVESTTEEIEQNGGTDPNLEEVLVNAERQYEAFLLMNEGLEKKDWSLYWQGELLNNSWQEESKEEQLKEVLKSYLWPTPFTVFTMMDKMRWMEKRSIQPIFPTSSHTWRTLYDEQFDDPIAEEIVTSSSGVYSSSGFYFVYHLFNYGFGFFGLFFVLFFFADILTKEGLDGNGPIQLLRTQPISRMKFWISKAVASMGGSILLIGFTATISLVLGSVFNRLGDWNYPILIYGPERTYSFLTLTSFLGKSLILFSLVLALSFTCLFLFSILANRTLLGIGLTVVFLVIGQLLTDQSMLLNWSHWLPFHYINVYPIVDGTYAVQYENENYTYLQAILSLSLSTGILLAMTYLAGRLKKGVKV